MRLSYRYNGRQRQALKVHPDSLCSAVTDIEVEIMRPCAGSLILSYLVTSSHAQPRVSSQHLQSSQKRSWQTTGQEQHGESDEDPDGEGRQVLLGSAD
jgi:hypothetical protein